MNQNDYIRYSLELHLFFDRIMKEHSLFLEAAFTDKDKELKKIANDFQMIFSDILKNIVSLANGRISRELLMSGEIVTNNTLEAEKVTSNLLNTNIDTNITERELNLQTGNVIIDNQFINEINNINDKTLPVIRNLIQFKSDILNNVTSCSMYTTNYPLLITHIMNEAKMYYNLLSKVNRREKFTKNYIYEQELFWNNIMKEHAEFIRGLLDPSEIDLILTADKYANYYNKLIKNSNNVNYTTSSLNETISFRNFKVAGEEGILNCKVKSIIIPLLADHVVREANHFIRILSDKKGNF